MNLEFGDFDPVSARRCQSCQLEDYLVCIWDRTHAFAQKKVYAIRVQKKTICLPERRTLQIPSSLDNYFLLILDFWRRMIEDGRYCLNGQHNFVDWGPRQNKKEKMLSTNINNCFLTVAAVCDKLSHSPLVVLSPP